MNDDQLSMEEIDVLLRAQHPDGRALQRKSQVARRHTGMDILRRQAVTLGYSHTQRFHSQVVDDPVQRHKVL